MRDYELTVLFGGNLEEKELDREIKLLSDFLTKTGAEIKSKRDPEKKPLAYQVGKFREGWYVFFELALSPGSVVTIEDRLKVSDNVIRYLLVRKI